MPIGWTRSKVRAGLRGDLVTLVSTSVRTVVGRSTEDRQAWSRVCMSVLARGLRDRAVVDKFQRCADHEIRRLAGVAEPTPRRVSTDHLDRCRPEVHAHAWVCNVVGGPFEYVGTRPAATQVALKKRIATCRSLPRSSTRSRPSWPAPSTRSGFPSARRRDARRLRGTQGRGDGGLPGRRRPLNRSGGGLSGIERAFYSALRELRRQGGLPDQIDCSCGAAVTIAELREHLVRRHCNVEGCSERALRTVSFGFRDPQFRIIGVPMGYLPASRALDRKGRMHVIVDPPRG
jgi:hypothetical protein